MIAVDTNLLIYAHRQDSPWHRSANQCVKGLAEGSSPWAIPWPCVHEFLAIVTHPRIFDPPTPLGRAAQQVDAWLASPKLVLLGEGPGYWAGLRDRVLRSRIAGPKVHDARIATLCLHHGVRLLWTADRDFSRFPALKVQNPLV